MSRLNKTQILIIILLQLILLWSLEYLLESYTNWKVDDAFISYRYAENFTNGHGLVYNPGERVEGYTNFLWVVILAIAIKLGFDVVLTSLILGMILSGATVVLSYYISRLLTRTNSVSIFHFLPGFLLTVNFSFYAWSISGLETHLFVSLLTLSFYFIVRGNRYGSAGLCFALCALTRPEGVIYFGYYMVISAFKANRKIFIRFSNQSLQFHL